MYAFNVLESVLKQSKTEVKETTLEHDLVDVEFDVVLQDLLVVPLRVVLGGGRALLILLLVEVPVEFTLVA